jgi:hypothetical protein
MQNKKFPQNGVVADGTHPAQPSSSVITSTQLQNKKFPQNMNNFPQSAEKDNN